MDREGDKSKGAQNIAGNTSYFLTAAMLNGPTQGVSRCISKLARVTYEFILTRRFSRGFRRHTNMFEL